MIAVGLDFEHRTLTHRECAPPEIATAHQVLFRIREVGVCGTDREMAAFHLGRPPAGEHFLTIGHEAVGQVEQIGPAVTTLAQGDWVAPMVRRSCQPPCPQCASGRRDLCLTGAYTERGIFDAHGYFSEFAVDDECDLVRIPPSILDRAVLVEPLSVVEKALDTAFRIHEGDARTALVLGAGPVGILAALVLVHRGLEVAVHSLEPSSDPRAQLLASAGVRYTEGNLPQADLVIEATGAPPAAFTAMDRLSRNGVACILGARDGHGVFPARNLVLHNLRVFGSVNASPASTKAAVADLEALDPRPLDALIHRVPWAAYRESMTGPPAQRIKLVHRFE
ncbi:MAG: alcohol dehydrogenase catalytic domain-containing protein [Bryobacteraceae bacterium]